MSDQQAQQSISLKCALLYILYIVHYMARFFYNVHMLHEHLDQQRAKDTVITSFSPQSSEDKSQHA